MDKQELQSIIQEFYGSPLSYLEIRDGETVVKMRKPVGGPCGRGGHGHHRPMPPEGFGADAQAGLPGDPRFGDPRFDGAPGPDGPTGPTPAPGPAAPDSGPAPTSNVAPIPGAPALEQLTSPIVGVFYEASEPGAAPYVAPGQHVSEGDVVCLIEAMKMINEIKSPCTGTVVRVLARNGEPVGVGDVLMEIEAG